MGHLQVLQVSHILLPNYEKLAASEDDPIEVETCRTLKKDGKY
jgi:hypothetical protein